MTATPPTPKTTAPCGCPWDGISCPHCGVGAVDSHIVRHHVAAIGYRPYRSIEAEEDQ